jgi:hypothetical protein
MHTVSLSDNLKINGQRIQSSNEFLQAAIAVLELLNGLTLLGLKDLTGLNFW